MDKFNVGDRVVSPEGLLGTVVVIDDYIGVCHDCRDNMFHNLRGACESGHGWWYSQSRLTKLKPVFKGNIK